jgi:hypothetical protein
MLSDFRLGFGYLEGLIIFVLHIYFLNQRGYTKSNKGVRVLLQFATYVT